MIITAVVLRLEHGSEDVRHAALEVLPRLVEKGNVYAISLV